MIRLLACAAMVVLAAAGGAVAQDGSPQERIEAARAEREAARAEAAERAGELEVLEASEEDLFVALAALEEQVAAQAARVETARAAVAQAEAEGVAYRDRIAITVAERESLVDRARQRVVESYVTPQADELTSVLGTGDIYESARQQAVLDVVTSQDADLSDRFRSIGIELAEYEARTLEAAERAEAQRTTLAEALADLESAQAAEEELLADLQVRIDALSAEIDALEDSEAELAAVIARAQAEIDAANRPAPSVSTGGGSGSVGQLAWPTSGTLTSGFGPRWGRLHQGIDLAAPTGTSIVAAESGVVIHSGVLGGYGQTILIDHGNGVVTLYAHQSERLVGSGVSVARGELIGRVGSTGNSTGPHLHFEVRINGVARDPLGYL